jgi:hypothetical protein
MFAKSSLQERQAETFTACANDTAVSPGIFTLWYFVEGVGHVCKKAGSIFSPHAKLD